MEMNEVSANGRTEVFWIPWEKGQVMGVADDCRKPGSRKPFKHPFTIPETHSSSLKIGLNDPKRPTQKET